MAAPCHYALENALSSMLSTWKKNMSISGGILYNVVNMYLNLVRPTYFYEDASD